MLADALLVSLSAEEQEWTRAVHAVALRDWQRVNTKLYRVVLPSLLIDGPEFKRDDRTVREYVRLYLADGRGLIAWARSHVSVTDKDSQKKLRHTLAVARLKATATIAEISVHTQLMLDLWSLVAGNDADDATSLVDYYDELLVSMPTEPETSRVVQLRVWLANRVTDYRAGGLVATGSDWRIPTKARSERSEINLQHRETHASTIVTRGGASATEHSPTRQHYHWRRQEERSVYDGDRGPGRTAPP